MVKGKKGKRIKGEKCIFLKLYTLKFFLCICLLYLCICCSLGGDRGGQVEPCLSFYLLIGAFCFFTPYMIQTIKVIAAKCRVTFFISNWWAQFEFVKGKGVFMFFGNRREVRYF